MFDYVEFVAEYAPFDLYALDNFCRAVELSDMSACIKVDQEPRRFITQRAIGAGFQSVLFADCRSAEDVRECVRSVRPDTPDAGGTYGATDRRFTYAWQGGSPQYVQALNDIVVAIMIEKRSTVDQLEEVLSVGGVDMITWGGADYSMSIGRPGAWGDPDVKAVERDVIQMALDMGVAPRIAIGSVEAADYYLDMGVRHFCMGTDIVILYGWLREHGAELRELLADRA
jgi:4-hydroxy-2-oxoheptanedioate aldolase